MNHDGLQQPTTQNKSTEREESMEDKKPAFVFSRHIGNTTYSTNVCFDPQAPCTFEDKLLRLIQNELLTVNEKCDILNAPQMSRQSERRA